jgi:hypothetical protein
MAAFEEQAYAKSLAKSARRGPVIPVVGVLGVLTI